MLIPAHASRKRQVRAPADEPAAPALVVHVEVILHDPTLRDLQMPAIVLLVPDSDHDAGRFATFHDRHHLVWFRSAEVRVEELIPPVFRCFENRRTPLLGTVHYPVLELTGGFAQHIPAHGVLLAISVEE